MKTWIPDARNFAYLTWKQVDALPRESTLLVLPTAAIEQHGHHLPLATDTLINICSSAKRLIFFPVTCPFMHCLPSATAKQRAYRLSWNAFRQRANVPLVVRDLGASIAASGFKKVVLYNTHGGNTSLVDVLARDLRAEFGLRTFSLFALLARPSKVSVHRSAPMASMPVRSKPPFCSMPRPLWSIRMNTPRTTLPASISLNC